MPEPLIDVRRRIEHLERRRNLLWLTVDRCGAAARVHRRSAPFAELVAQSAIAKAHAQCLRVEIYALRAMVGVARLEDGHG